MVALRNLFTGMLLLGVFSSTALALDPAAAKKWSGHWDAMEDPPESPEVYFNYHIELTKNGFKWTSAHQEEPYGPNETLDEGEGVFVDEHHATDTSKNLLFTLVEGATPRQKRLVVKALKEPQGSLENTGVDYTFFFIPDTFQAGFDCEKASTPIENTLCHDRRLAQADKEMGGLFKEAKGKLSKDAVAGLVADQKQWVTQRNACMKGKEVNASCLRRSYAHRLAALEKIIDPSLGKGPLFDAEFLAGLYKKGGHLGANTIIQLLLLDFEGGKETAVELTQRQSTYKAEITPAKTTITGSYSFSYVCYPADCEKEVTFHLTADKNGNIQFDRQEKSNEEAGSSEDQ
ncbi:MAG: lysozyme inhibitor LprI family protein [Deltaproteobacteria bacterium]|nr:lysozyme inhibitor LprI family protein [Deltaproteobacteria bacterium]